MRRPSASMLLSAAPCLAKEVVERQRQSRGAACRPRASARPVSTPATAVRTKTLQYEVLMSV